MRDERLVCVIAAAVSKQLGVPVSILQTSRFTEWRTDDKGFAVGPTATSYPPRKLVDVLVNYLRPLAPLKKRKHDDNED